MSQPLSLTHFWQERIGKSFDFNWKDLISQIRKNRVAQQEIILFSQQLSTMLKTGLPLVTALRGIAEQVKGGFFRETIKVIIKDIEGGQMFSKALGKHPGIFNEFYIGMIQVGETAGILDEAFERLAAINAKEMNFKTQLKAALVYPSMLVVASIVVIIFLIGVIIPKFTVIFESYNAKLPFQTRLLLGVSFFLKKFWYLLLALMIGGGIWGMHLMRQERVKFRFFHLLFRVPLFGELYFKILIARFARSLGVMVKTGVPLLEALSIAEKTLTNPVLLKEIQKIRQGVSGGRSLTYLFEKSDIFPALVTQMIALGERSGKLDDVLNGVATYYDQESEQAFKNITTVIEPTLLLTMGGIVAFIALSVLLPIFNLIKLFKSG